MNRYIASLLLVFAAMVLPRIAPAQADSARSSDMVRVFLDCDERGCDREYFQEQVAFVDWVRDRGNADVHLLISTISTGGGGTQYSLLFIGTGRYGTARDSLGYNSVPNEAVDITRGQLAQRIKLGMIPFAARTTAARNITVSYSAPATAPRAATRDPWNSWTFEISTEAFGNGEQSYGQLHLFSQVEANRITAEWKTELELTNVYNATRFELSEGTFRNYQRSSSAEGLLGKSLGARWTAGGYASVGRSDFQNQRFYAGAGPALEYNLFPYAQATSRQLTFQYLIGPRHFRYVDTTLYDKVEESLLYHQLRIGLRARQRWGSSNVTLSAASYPTAPDFYRLTADGFVELQVVKGLSMRLGGYAARVNDQLHLQKGDLTDEERLVRQRSLATNFEYFFSAGLSYRFGSIYNTVVNPRFRNLGNSR